MLLGDSAPSELPSNILDTIVELCLCARDVSVAHVEISELWKQLDQAEFSFSEIGEQLQRFRRVGESGLLASVEEATRPEMKEHGHQAADALGRMIDGWLAQYQGARDAAVSDLRRKIDGLHARMTASLDRFALPLRAQPMRRVVRRTLEGSRYNDTATLELLPGLRVNLELEDTEPEQPRRLRSLLGKGLKLQVGTKRGLLRRTEEPAHIALDDLLISTAEITADTARLELVKKPGGPLVLKLGLSASGDRVLGRGVLPDGGGNPLPDEDRRTVEMLWAALQSEADRIVASPARSDGYALRDEVVETPAGFVNVAERIVEHYRPSIHTIMAHSPNREELTVKVEVGERREEKWIRRDELAGHLSRIPEAFRARLTIPEVEDPSGALPKVEAPAVASAAEPPALPAAAPASPPPAPAPAKKKKPEASETKATAVYQAVPTVEAVPADDTQDISLTELVVEDEEERVSSGGLPVPDLSDGPSSGRRSGVLPRPRSPVKKPPPPASLRRKPKS